MDLFVTCYGLEVVEERKKVMEEGRGRRSWKKVVEEGRGRNENGD